ncbi:hypothetical protein V2J94_41100 [Streptomyces sp. DSM 41524]|uniref:Uncharacterized protein n=1 Tax=Streptomyces asiaticus subsp. ignotus TaxID=3098222 RepID=A0ABU7QCT3_9ACTN|nr:hypothetical protein [Streptomyces sp. DSM 41524]
MNPKASAYLYAALDQLGVQVRAGVEVVKVLPDAVTSHAGRRRAALPPARFSRAGAGSVTRPIPLGHPVNRTGADGGCRMRISCGV